MPGRLPGARRTRGLAIALTALLPLVAVGFVMLAWASAYGTSTVAGIRGGFTSPLDLERAASVVWLAAVFAGATSVLTVVAFFVWSWQTFANARLIAAGSTPGTGWAVGAWLIPFVNVVGPPYNLMRVDQASDDTRPGARWLIVTWAVLFWAWTEAKRGRSSGSGPLVERQSGL